MRIGVFCSGGDAPGMNACVRAVVRTAVAAGHEVVGIRRGYQGLLDEDFQRRQDGRPLMTLRCVSGLSRLGGTLLLSSRSAEFRTEAGLAKAVGVLDRHKIDALVPIGGDGTFHGAVELEALWGGRIVGCPGTIDNDLKGTDATIGFATAVHTAVDAVDKLRDTAESHQRAFLLEVMGRHSGYIALYTALAAGAEIVCVPETPTDIPAIIERLDLLKRRGKKSIIIIVAEGDEYGEGDSAEKGKATQINEALHAYGCAFSTRVVALGHIQRGGAPSADDRILATRLGAFAARSILDGATGVMAGQSGSQLSLVPLPETFDGHKALPEEYLDLLEAMAN